MSQLRWELENFERRMGMVQRNRNDSNTSSVTDDIQFRVQNVRQQLSSNFGNRQSIRQRQNPGIIQAIISIQLSLHCLSSVMQIFSKVIPIPQNTI